MWPERRARNYASIRAHAIEDRCRIRVAAFSAFRLVSRGSLVRPELTRMRTCERSSVVHRRTSDAGGYVRGYVESGVVAEDHADEDAGAEFAGLVGRNDQLEVDRPRRSEPERVRVWVVMGEGPRGCIQGPPWEWKYLYP